jgi:phosphatidylglycerophosphate synthase
MDTMQNEFVYEKSLKKVSSFPFIRRFLPFDRWVVRPPASLVVKAVFKTNVTPNHLTMVSFVLALLAALAFSRGRYPFFALAGCLSLASTIFDAADGMLARAKAMTSRYGAYLDLFLDRLGDFTVMAGVAFGYARYSGRPRFLVFGLMTVALYFLQLTLYYVSILYARSEKSGESAEAKSLAVCGLFVSSLAGRPDLFLGGIFVMTLICVIVLVVRFLAKGKDPEASPTA